MAGFNYKRLYLEISENAAQRKKENEEFLENNLQTLTNGGPVEACVFDETSSHVEDGFFKLDATNYQFAQFNELMFGQELADKASQLFVIEQVEFYFCDFNLCGFSNLRFVNCSFIGCNFNECYTMGFISIFESCRFMNRIEGEVSIDDAPSMFKGCEFSVRFINSDLSMTVFDQSHFYFTLFDTVNFKGTIFLGTSFDTVTMKDCNLKDTKILKPKVTEFYFENSAKASKVSKHTFFDKINFNPKEVREVRFAIETYSQISELFEENKLMDLSGEYFYLFKKTEALSLKGFEKFKSLIGFIVCGYGERPLFSLASSLALILTCGTLYMFFGVSLNNEIIQFRPSANQLFPPFNELIIWYHFSLVTFSTVGYGNVVPVNGSLIVSAFEMVLGIIMVGIWVSTLVRKMVR
jgi:uncharacterized protein YjbI with pentapeptide repeats